MLSTCPNCKKQIEHEDYLFEVSCECGMRFNPFMDLGTPAAETPLTPAWADPSGTTAPDPNAFAESHSVFAELKEFAEGTAHATTAKPSVLDKPSTAAAPVPFAAVPSSEPIITSGDGLPGYRIEAYLAPVSATGTLNAADANPMRPGFDALWNQAIALGANGIVAVRWVLSPDGSKVILSGTPVRCTKD